MSRLKKYDKKFLLESLREMMLVRHFEEKAGQMYGLRKIGGFCHLYNGQEAVASGSIRALDLSRDYVLTSYRDHAHAIVCGMDPKRVMAELYGKATGVSKGKGGSMHMFDLERHMLGGNGIVGGQIPVATGVAFAQAYWFKLGKTKDMGVTLCYFGDGAIHQGAFHESLNLAKIWKLPVIFMVENNKYGMGTAVSRVSGVEDFHVKAGGYDIEGVQINGMDFIEVYEKTRDLVAKSRKTGESFLVDVKTYRFRGHSMSDPAKYRTKEELEEYKRNDPIFCLKFEMIKEGLMSEKAYEKMDKEVIQESEEAVKFAEESPEPSLSAMYEDIYAN